MGLGRLNPGCGCTCGCVLSVAVGDECAMLSWSCQCPGGTLKMQKRNTATGGWENIAGWVADGENFWWPYDFNRLNGTSVADRYRLKCEEPNGTARFYSNDVSALLYDKRCKAYDVADAEKVTLGVEVDYIHETYTYNPGTGITTWAPPTFLTARGGCLPLESYGLGGNPTTVLYENSTTRLDMLFGTTTSSPPRYDFIFRSVNKSTGITSQSLIWRRLWSELTRAWKCWPGVHSLTSTSGFNTIFYCDTFVGLDCTVGGRIRITSVNVTGTPI
jgi:hypothetical protein